MQLNLIFTVGIEEEYLLVNPETDELPEDPTQEIFTECERHLLN